MVKQLSRIENLLRIPRTSLRNTELNRQDKSRSSYRKLSPRSIINPTEEATLCKFCKDEEEMSMHILYECEGLAKLIFLILGEEKHVILRAGDTVKTTKINNKYQARRNTLNN